MFKKQLDFLGVGDVVIDTFIELAAGDYDYVCNATSSQNYTSAIDSAVYIVNKDISVVNLLLNNTDNNITPKTIKKNIDDIMISTSVADGYKKSEQKEKRSDKDRFKEYLELDSIESIIELLEMEMHEASENLNFEKAAELRDRIFELKEL